jgi:cysteine dioxygenase
MNRLVSNLRHFFMNQGEHSQHIIHNYLLNALFQYDVTDWKNARIPQPKDSYEKNIIHREPLFSLEIVSWGDSAVTKFHDHAEFGCYMKLLDGKLREELLVKRGNNSHIETKMINQGETSFINNKMGIHRLMNTNENNMSHSLHIYIPGKYNTKYYEY